MTEFSKNEKIKVWVLLIILALIWGSSFILIKKGLESFSPLQVGTIRMIFAFLVTLPFALKSIRKVPKERYKGLFFSGATGNLIPAILFAMAETNLESSLTGVLNALSPLFTLLIAFFIFKYKFTSAKILGLILGLIGTMGLSFVNDRGGLGEMNVYVLLVVFATFLYGVNLNYIQAYLSDMSSLVITSLAMFFIGPLSFLILLTTDFFFVLFNSPDALESLAYIAILGVMGTAVALVIYTKVILITNAIFASIVTYMIPIVAIFWGLAEGEKIYPLHLAAMLLILLGIYLSNKNDKLSAQKE